MKILITGAAGFIGFHLVEMLTLRGDHIVGIDNINDYYDIELKFARLAVSGIRREKIHWHTQVQSDKYVNYKFIRMNLEDKDYLMSVCQENAFDIIINLAAQAGVRYSIDNPDAYVQSNVVGFLNILEACRQFKVRHLIFASSSSVYGMNQKMPFSEADKVDQPASLYAATKRSNELMAHAYTHLFKFRTTGLRFFTVYGPWGRPDMAYFLFVKAIQQGRPINVYNHGKLKRDFTYIDDIVNGIVSVVDKSDSNLPEYKLYNIGNNTPVDLSHFIGEIEKQLGIEAVKNYMDMQPGDVLATWADIGHLVNDFGYNPSTTIDAGMEKFVAWYKQHYS